MIGLLLLVACSVASNVATLNDPTAIAVNKLTTKTLTDGTCVAYFTYFTEIEQHVEIGEKNYAKPGPYDAGQPTHFVANSLEPASLRWNCTQFTDFTWVLHGRGYGV